jgi:DnaJ-domain-containing protein 1
LERRDAEPVDYFVIGLTELAEEEMEAVLDVELSKSPHERDFGAIFASGLFKVLASVARVAINSQLKEPIDMGIHRKSKADTKAPRNKFVDKISAYAVLGLREGASEAEIKERYRNLVRFYHPDASQNQETSEIFSQITDAYRSLI